MAKKMKPQIDTRHAKKRGILSKEEKDLLRANGYDSDAIANYDSGATKHHGLKWVQAPEDSTVNSINRKLGIVGLKSKSEIKAEEDVVGGQRRRLVQKTKEMISKKKRG